MSVNSRLPLAATIHATEYGRNRGIHNDIQRRIHSLEERLVNSADVIICCSSYMVEEITRLFEVTRKKLFLIPNGVDPANLGIPRQLVPGEKEPRLYEPFGIVALEAMTAQIPVIVSDTGGLSEVVSHGIDGYKAPLGRPDILAYYIREILVNPGLAMDLTRRAWNKVLTVYDWNNIAVETLDVYREAGIIARGN